MKIGFTLSSTKALRETFFKASKGSNVPLEGDKIAVSLSKAIRQIRFSAEEDRLLIATEGGELLIYKVEDIKTNVRKRHNTVNECNVLILLFRRHKLNLFTLSSWIMIFLI